MFAIRNLIVLSFIVLSGCASVVISTKDPSVQYKSKLATEAFKYLDTSIGALYADTLENDENLSGAMLIANGSYALYHRIALTRMAQHTIELQTYIYDNDFTSRLLMHEMKLAADRGVHVRILVDDLGLDSDHSDIIHLNDHPNIEVKVFNIFRPRTRILRYPQLVGSLLRLSRLNNRMHNKVFCVDNSVAIIGGRNVADNYFDNKNINFSDTEVLFLGKLARDATFSFYRYWNYHRAIPVALFPQNKIDLDELDVQIKEEIKASGMDYDSIIAGFTESFTSKSFSVYWGRGELIADSPYKVDGMEPESPILNKLLSLIAESDESLYITSAYLIPGKEGAKLLIDTFERGVDVRVLTNSLASTDVVITYIGWIPYRDQLLDKGIKVFEFRATNVDTRERGNSGASLHSKVMVFDNETTWVGSYNMDPRSNYYNTEIVALFYSPEFAELVSGHIKGNMSIHRSWELTRSGGATWWHTIREGEPHSFGYIPDVDFHVQFLSLFLLVVPEHYL